MTKRIFAVLLAVVMLCMCTLTCYAAPAEEHPIQIKGYSYDAEKEILTLTVVNVSETNIVNSALVIDATDEAVTLNDTAVNEMGNTGAMTGELRAGAQKDVIFNVSIENYEKFAEAEKMPVVNAFINYILESDEVYAQGSAQNEEVLSVEYDDILNTGDITTLQAILNFLNDTGFAKLGKYWKNLVMILISCVLIYLAIGKGFEPLLLLPIAFGMLLTNLPGADIFHEELFAGGHAHWNLFDASNAVAPGLLDFLYLGVKLGIYPCLIFFGVGAMTDFEPLIANPKSLILGAAAQIGIFATFIGASAIGFTTAQAGSIGIIGGADGPTAIFVTSKLAPELLGPIAVAAYSYMALVPVIQPPIMKLLTTKKEREIVMKPLRKVSKIEKILFPIVVTVFVALLVPSATALVGSLMLGNLFKESGVTERLSKTVQNELMNIVTIFLGVSVGATATANTFLAFETIKIIVMGVVAFSVATAFGVIFAKVMNLFLKNKINPLIGSAGVSAVPMAARVSQKVGQECNPSNFLLMHAMGPNVAGVIGSAIAAGALLAMIPH